MNFTAANLMIDLQKVESGSMVRFYWSDVGSVVTVSHYSHGKLATTDKLEIKQARLCWKDLIRAGFTKVTQYPIRH